MRSLLYIPLILVLLAFQCKKDTKIPDPEEPVIEPKQDSIYFVFVNRIGYKNDSVNIGGGNVRYLFAVNLETGYYNVKTNKSEIREAIYARTISTKLTDSIIHAVYPCFVNSRYNMNVSLYWNVKNGNSYTRVRNLTFQSNPFGNDTVKTSGNKTIKFVWPVDTASGKFTKTYDSPN